MYKFVTRKKLHVLEVFFKGCSQLFFFFHMKIDAHERSDSYNYQSTSSHMKASKDVKIRDGTLITAFQYKSRDENQN